MVKFSVTLHGAEQVMVARFYHIAGLSPRISSSISTDNFQGRLQGLVINGERILDEAHLKQIEYEGSKINLYFSNHIDLNSICLVV